jgi:hypothetical protein
LSFLQIKTALQMLSVVVIFISFQFIADYSFAEHALDKNTVIAVIIQDLMQELLLK